MHPANRPTRSSFVLGILVADVRVRSLLRVDLAVCVAILILMWRQYTGRYHDANIWMTRIGYTLFCQVYLYLWYVLHIYMAWRVWKLRNTESEVERAIRRDVYLAVMGFLNNLTGYSPPFFELQNPRMVSLLTDSIELCFNMTFIWRPRV